MEPVFGWTLLSPEAIRRAEAQLETVKLWETRTDKLLLSLDGHTSSVNSVAWSPNGSMVASGSLDGSIRVWSIIGEPCRAIFLSLGELDWMTYTPQGDFIGSDGVEERVMLALEREGYQFPAGHRFRRNPGAIRLALGGGAQNNQPAASSKQTAISTPSTPMLLPEAGTDPSDS